MNGKLWLCLALVGGGILWSGAQPGSEGIRGSARVAAEPARGCSRESAEAQLITAAHGTRFEEQPDGSIAIRPDAAIALVAEEKLRLRCSCHTSNREDACSFSVDNTGAQARCWGTCDPEAHPALDADACRWKTFPADVE